MESTAKPIIRLNQNNLTFLSSNHASCHDSITLKEKVSELSNLIICSKHIIVYTGDAVFEKPTDLRKPSETELLLVNLINEGIIETIITTNEDGVQQLGLSPEKLIQVYGSPYQYCCDKCQNTIFFSPPHDLSCPTQDCKGNLSVHHILEGQTIPSSTLHRLKEVAQSSDLAIVIGCSMDTLPISTLPMLPFLQQRQNKKLAICHNKATPFDLDANCRIYGSPLDILTSLLPLLPLKEKPTININTPSIDTVAKEDDQASPTSSSNVDTSTQHFLQRLQESGKKYLPWNCKCGFVNQSYPSICEGCDVKNPSYLAQARSVDTDTDRRQFLAELLVWGRH
eukprot:TRINITY_DN4004_c0_g1_i1.p1 TRINITY_DN4004_c0_g1~~TRINITY_DN4004_c0_g1_i1.p1  ORF type:complete len:339 (-),score=50.77 TRINITY_DN4004_c0_g1_i1:137-1153(-)